MAGEGPRAAPAAGPLATSVCRLRDDAARELARDRNGSAHGRPAPARLRVRVVLEAAGPLSRQEIGWRLCADRPAVVHVVGVPEGRGPVARARDAAGRRACSIRLTDAGRTPLADVLHPATEAVRERMLGGPATGGRGTAMVFSRDRPRSLTRQFARSTDYLPLDSL